MCSREDDVEGKRKEAGGGGRSRSNGRAAHVTDEAWEMQRWELKVPGSGCQLAMLRRDEVEGENRRGRGA